MTDDLLPSPTDIITTRELDTPDGVLPAGSKGTIVSDYNHSGVYLGEFEAPWHVVQVSRADLVPIDELAAIPRIDVPSALTGADRR